MCHSCFDVFVCNCDLLYNSVTLCLSAGVTDCGSINVCDILAACGTVNYWSFSVLATVARLTIGILLSVLATVAQSTIGLLVCWPMWHS